MDQGIADTGHLPSAADSDLARRVTALAAAGMVDGAEWQAVQGELARRRAIAHGQKSLSTGETLRSQILKFLAQTPGSTPSEIAGALDRSTTVVSRVLTTLKDAKLVDFEKNALDGRARHYQLIKPDAVSPLGVVTPPSDDEEQEQYLGLVIAAAVRARRRSNDLGYAIDRLERVLRRATDSKLHDLALIARRELVTTLRQRNWRDTEVGNQVRVFAEMAAGEADVEPRLVSLALACLDYETGRRNDLPARERLEYVISAATAYRRCRSLDEAHDWAPREGWSLLAAAEIWRQQTEFGTALAFAKRAEEVFVEYDDTYGTAEATRMLGFCQRLRGNFDDAIIVLRRSLKLAEESSSDRSRADILLQLGDSLRCTGDFPAAVDSLTEAADLARELDRKGTLGFSLTALAAVYYTLDDLDRAWDFASKATPFLEELDPGRALNRRRRAVIARDLADNGNHVLRSSSAELFRQAMADYRSMDSPAGLAACCVGLGRLNGPSRGPDDAISQLVSVASSGVGRLLLPIDPWVPTLLTSWASETENKEIERVAEWTYRSDEPELNVHNANEMAGEARKKSVLLVG